MPKLRGRGPAAGEEVGKGWFRLLPLAALLLAALAMCGVLGLYQLIEDRLFQERSCYLAEISGQAAEAVGAAAERYQGPALQDAVETGILQGRGRVCVVDSGGLPVFPDGGGGFPGGGPIAALDGCELLHGAQPDDPRACLSGGTGGCYEFLHGREQWLAAISPVPGTDWSVVALAPADVTGGGGVSPQFAVVLGSAGIAAAGMLLGAVLTALLSAGRENRRAAGNRGVMVQASGQAAAARDLAAAPRQEEDWDGLRGARLLLAEDNVLNMEFARCLLEEQGIEVAAAVNGREAVDAFASEPPGAFDGILMDMMMPVMDGLEATRAIRAMDRPDAAAIPIFAVTVNVFEEDKRRCLEAGMNAHIAKPIDRAALLRTLAQFIGTGGANGGAPRHGPA